MKELLPNDIDSDNEVDTESEEGTSATSSMELIVAYLDDLDCNNPPKMRANGVLNENVTFDYSLCLENVFKSIDISSLHMPMPISKMACMNIDDIEGGICFIVPPSKRDQSLIIFGRGQARATTSRESDDDLEPP